MCAWTAVTCYFLSADLANPLTCLAGRGVQLPSGKWKTASHITALETRGALAALRWRLRSRWNLASRFGHLLDNQASIGVLTRCRSTSYVLNVVVKRCCALVVAALARPFYAYCETDRNPADAATRQEEPPD